MEEYKYGPKKIKMENLTDNELEKILTDESASESDNYSNNKTESDDEENNDEYNEWFVKS